MRDAAMRAELGDAIALRHILVKGALGTGKKTTAEFIAMLLNLIHCDSDSQVELDKLSQKEQIERMLGLAPPVNNTPLKKGDKVVLVPNFKDVGDAAGGPMKVGDVGVIHEDDGTGSPFRVTINGNQHSYWYRRDAFMHAPPKTVPSRLEPKKDVMEALDDLGVVVLRELKDLIDPKTGDFSDKLTPRTVFFIKAQGGATKNDVDGRVLREMLRPAVRSVCVIVGDHAAVGKYEELEVLKATWPSTIDLAPLDYRTLSQLVVTMADEKLCVLRRDAGDGGDLLGDGDMDESEKLKLMRYIAQQTFKVRETTRDAIARVALHCSCPFACAGAVARRLARPARRL